MATVMKRRARSKSPKVKNFMRTPFHKKKGDQTFYISKMKQASLSHTRIDQKYVDDLKFAADRSHKNAKEIASMGKMKRALTAQIEQNQAWIQEEKQETAMIGKRFGDIHRNTSYLEDQRQSLIADQSDFVCKQKKTEKEIAQLDIDIANGNRQLESVQYEVQKQLQVIKQIKMNIARLKKPQFVRQRTMVSRK